MSAAIDSRISVSGAITGNAKKDLLIKVKSKNE